MPARRGQAIGGYASGAALENPEATMAFRFLYAFWRMCEQLIAAQIRGGSLQISQAVAP